MDREANRLMFKESLSQHGRILFTEKRLEVNIGCIMDVKNITFGRKNPQEYTMLKKRKKKRHH